MTIDLNYFKTKLEQEKSLLESELNNIGHHNPLEPGSWEVTPAQTAAPETRDDVAEKFEEWDERQAAEGPLVKQLQNVTSALVRLATGTYGLCQVCNQPIEESKLKANASTKTCLKHKEDEANL